MPNAEHQPPSAARPYGRTMFILAWIVALAMLTLFIRQWEAKQHNPNAAPQGSLNNGIREVILQGNRSHHYIATGIINGQPVTFLLDTGATDVVIPGDLAHKLSLPQGPVGYAQTANGVIEVRATRLNTLQLGNIQLNDVRASINPAMKDQEVLLGMSALRQVEFTQRNGQLILRQQP